MVNLTLLDWANRLDPDGSVPVIAEILSQTNEILTDMVVKEGNLPTGDKVTIRTGLPTVYYRALNEGVPTSKSNTTQVTEGCAIAEAWSEVDKKLAELNGNTAEFRLSEAEAFIEAMNQTIATGMFYGNPKVNPKQFLGLTQRYSDTTAANAQNILSAGGSTANEQTSVWFVGWGNNTCYSMFPKGMRAGLEHNDMGERVSFDVNGNAGQRLVVLMEQFVWNLGLVVKDWRSCARVCNIDTSEFAGLTGTVLPTSTQGLLHKMITALGRIPKKVRSMGNLVCYMNPSVYSVLNRIAVEKNSAALSIVDAGSQFGVPGQGKVMMFFDVPIRQCDAILNTEAVV